MSEKHLITTYFNLHNAKQFVESINEEANSVYYVFAAKSTPFDNGDDNVPNIINTNNTVNIDPYKNMVFGKRVSVNDVKVMIPRYDWVSGTQYSEYSSNTDLTGSKYYAVVNNASYYYVFKVLDNNNGANSVIRPSYYETGADDDYYSTSDGYVWKYMYKVEKSVFDRFATSEYIPVVEDVDVQANAVSGVIDIIKIKYPGSNYNTYLSNTFLFSDLTINGNNLIYGIANNAPSTNAFYVASLIYITDGTGIGQYKKIIGYNVIGNSKQITIDSEFAIKPDSTSVYEITPSVVITGDGTNAIARALVNSSSSNSIYKIEIISRGSGYTYANAVVQGNTGGISNSAILSVVYGPKGGHGKNPQAELGGKYVGISVTFSNNESGSIPTKNDYRTIGIIKDPLFSNVNINISNTSGLFIDNEIVIQANTNATGKVKEKTLSSISLTDVKGIFETGKTLTGLTSGTVANVTSYDINGEVKNFNTFDNRLKYSYTSSFGNFIEDEQVFQLATEFSNAYFHSNTSTYVYLLDKKGIINLSNTITGTVSSAVMNLGASWPSDIVEGSGEILYIENIDPIDRNDLQSETIKLILKF